MYCVSVCLCVCLCVTGVEGRRQRLVARRNQWAYWMVCREREREREREGGRRGGGGGRETTERDAGGIAKSIVVLDAV